jgi:hypothetical protein
MLLANQPALQLSEFARPHEPVRAGIRRIKRLTARPNDRNHGRVGIKYKCGIQKNLYSIL